MHLRTKDADILLDTLTLSLYMCSMMVLCFLCSNQPQLLSTPACADFRRALVSMRRPLHGSEAAAAVASRFLKTNRRTPRQKPVQIFPHLPRSYLCHRSSNSCHTVCSDTSCNVNLLFSFICFIRERRASIHHALSSVGLTRPSSSAVTTTHALSAT